MIKSLTNLQRIEFSKVIRAKHIAIPAEHGAWIFLLSPLTIGLFLGGFSKGSLPLVFAMLAAFLIRQPVTIMVKVFSNRRSKNDLYPALVWCTFYGLILIVSLLLLIFQICFYPLSGCACPPSIYMASLAGQQTCRKATKVN